MKPCSKSVWITPAAWGAREPLVTVQARVSFGPDGEEGEQAQQLITGADHAVEARFFQPDGIQEILALVIGQLRDLLFHPGRNHHRAGAFGLGLGFDLLGIFVAGLPPTPSSTLQT